MNCTGGSGGIGNYGVNFVGNFAMSSGLLQFSNVTGGGTLTDNYGVVVAATVTAPTILGSDIFGGPGALRNYGLYVSGGLGSTITNELRVSAGSLGTDSDEYGIYVTGSVTANTITLMGSGGGLYSNSSSSANYGIYLSGALLTSSSTTTLTGLGGTGTGGGHHGVAVASTNVNNSITFLNCVGGSGGPSNYGVDFIGDFSMVTGTLQFTNVTGGGPLAGNYGVNVAGTVTAPIILGQDLCGGPGVGSNYGLSVTGTLGSSATTQIQIVASSIGTGGSEYGISISGAVMASTISLMGSGGGLYSNSVSGNHGISLSGATLTGSSSVALTGIGGTGLSGGHYGVQTATSLQLNSPVATFQNCIGGTGGSGNIGVNLAVPITMVSGTLQFTNISGGGPNGSNHGLVISSTVTVPTLIVVDLFGGPGNGTDFGLYLAGGTITTTVLDVVAGSLGTGSSEIGIYNAGTMIADAIVLSGTGGGLYSGTGSGNHGIELNGAILTGSNSIVISGIGGNGSNGGHYGVQTATSLQLNSYAASFLYCVGGSGGTANYGVNIVVPITMVSGTLKFLNISGGGPNGQNHGLVITSTVAAPTILAADLYGGPGSGTDYGLYLNGGTLSSSVLNVIAGSLGLGSNEIGIYDAGTMVASALSLNGSGGGLYSSFGQQNYGIQLDGAILTTSGTAILTGVGGTGSGGEHHGVVVNSVTSNTPIMEFLNCTGGNGGTGNYGVDFAGSFSMVMGELQFSNIRGGGSLTTNYGVYIGTGASVTAPVIFGSDIYGGPGIGSDCGFYIAGGTLGSSATNLINILAGSLGTGSTEYGIYVGGAIVVGDGGIMLLNGSGGGLYSSNGGNENHGIYLSSATLTAGIGGDLVNTITLTGIGGTGLGGNHYGVYGAASLAINLNGTGTSDTLNFLHCIGGTGGNSNYGVNLATNLTLAHGTLQFSSLTGGGPGVANHGLIVTATVTAPVIIGTDLYGGPGTGVVGNGNDGLYVGSGGTIGDPTLSYLMLSGGSLGIGSSEVGLEIDSGGALVVGSQGTISLTGTGGGLYSAATARNYGVFINGGSLTAGSTIAITGIGGVGTGSAGSLHHGVQIAGAMVNSSSLTFLNCTGGSGGNRNYGVNFAGNLTLVNGLLQFTNVTGGGGRASSNNFGVNLSGSVVAAPTILGMDIFGGPGSGNNYGLYIESGSTLGSSATNQLQISAGSLGIGSNEYGIAVAGSAIVGEGGTLTFVGTGGGLYSGAGQENYGIYLSGATFNVGNSLVLTGIGGSGLVGLHHGVFVDSSTTTVGLNSSSNTLTFLNCSGGSGAGSDGVDIFGNLALATGTLQFSNVTGGGIGASNYGVAVNGTVTAPTILGADIFGGPGSGTNYGLYVTGSIVADLLRISAGSLGLGSSEIGIYTTGLIQANSVLLVGSGGGLYSAAGQNNYGAFLSGTISHATVTGSGGVGTLGTHHGVVVSGLTANGGITFLNCSGGNGGPSNYGIDFSGNFSMVTGALQFANICGGGPGAGNYGIYITGIVTAPAIIGSDIFGGPGTGADYGLYIHGGTLGSSGFGQIDLTAGSLGLGSSETGVLIDSSGTVVANTVALTGIGGGFYSALTSSNYGLSISSGSVKATAAVTLTGFGGTGVNGTNYGLDLETATLAGSSITLTGFGGTGTAGSNYGVYTTTATINSTLATFLNCVGGTGGSFNHGVNLSTGLTLINGTLQFSNVTGGGNGTASNYGLYIPGTVNAPTILGTDIHGGPGTNNNWGLYVTGTLEGSQLRMSCGSLGTGSNEYGINIGGTVSGKTVALTGVGGGLYSAGGQQNQGIFLSGATLTGTNSITLTGIGGSGTGGLHHGINATTSLKVNSNSLTFLNCAGGLGGIGNCGVALATNLQMVSGTLQFSGATGGGSISNNYGLWISATVTAPAILASDIFGGPGSSNDYGLYINGGTLGSSILSHLTLTAGSLGMGSGEVGIYSTGSVIAGSKGVVTLVGLGGGLYSNSGEENYGICLSGATVTGGTSVTLTGIGGVGTAGFHHGVVCNGATATTATLTFLNCSGGQGGSNNYGVDFPGNFAMVNGALQFTNVVGGGTMANNYGVYIAAATTVQAPTILGADILGGPGVGSNIGLYLSGTLIGSEVRMSCGSLGMGGSEYGIYCSGTASATTVALTGAGGGLYSSGSSGNYGIYLQGATLMGPAVTLTGIGGVGTQGFHHGVVVDTVTANVGNLTFLHCTGGSGAVGSNYGVDFVGNLTLVSGLLQFSNVTGGGPGPTNYGVYISSTVTAPIILGADIYGGPGTNYNYGLYIAGGTLGSSATNQIRMSAGSIGLGLSEIGLRIDSGGSSTVGAGGTLSLAGTGGGLYNSAVAGNYGLSINSGSVSGTTIALTGVGGAGSSGSHYGVDLETATLTAGTGGTTTNAITISGMGGTGVGGSNYGVYAATALSINLNGTGNGDTLTFMNCTGGTSGANNYGVNLTTGLILAHGTLQFSSVTGGGTTIDNHGVLITSTVQAPAILCADLFGGPGTLLNHGLYIQGGTLGSAATSFIQVSAGSLGMGSDNYGIAIDTAGTIQAATIQLTGTGGGVYNGSGLQNYGISLDNALLVATTTTTLTGIGGTGSGGFHYGVAVDGVTSAGSALIFQNCSGGNGGNQNNGVDFIGNLSLVTGLLQFNNVTGGGSGTATLNDGVHIPTGVTVSAPTILGTDLLGGPGTGNNVGLHIAGTLGSSTTNQLYMSAGSLGQGSEEYGIYVDSGSAVVSDGGTLELIGTGGGLYITSGSNNHGIDLSDATLTAGNGGPSTNAILLTGIGGAGEGSGHCGVNIENSFTANLNGTSNGDALTFQNCVGGLGSSSNIGVYFTSTGATTLNRGTLYLIHISGGSNPGSTYNDGVRIVSTVAATNIIGHDLYGGAGSSSDVGLNLDGGTLSAAQRLSIVAGSMGLGSNEVGIYILNGTVDATVVELTGSGGGLYSASGSRNIGILLSAASLTGSSSATITGIGGTGTGGTNHGVEINTSFSATSSALTFIHCAGGVGGNNNIGINFITNLALTNGSLIFSDIVGGSNLQQNYGLYLSGTVTAPTIQLTDILGGPGTGSDYGFYLNGGTLGSTAEFSVSAGSLGLGSNEIGIYLAGTLSGAISLQGTGGGFYSSGGSGNIGVVIAGATLGVVEISGIGGTGTGGGHHGVSIVSTTAVSGTNSAQFIQCFGGSGGSGNYGVNIGASLSQAAGTLSFQNIHGGGPLANNYGVYAAASVTASTITAVDVMGGIGTGGDIGFYINSGTCTATTLSIQAGSSGSGTGEIGIQIGSATLQVNGTAYLQGSGGGGLSSSSSGDIGVSFASGSTLSIASGATAYVIGNGGFGSGGQPYGAYWDGTLSFTDNTSALVFTDCMGGLGGTESGTTPNNAGLVLAAALAPTEGTITLSNVQGGGPLPGQGTACANNFGLILNAIQLSAPTLSIEGIQGGPGSGKNVGLYIHGGTLGSSTTTTLTVAAESHGTGSTEVGILIDSSGIVECAASGAVTLVGYGSRDATGSGNYGVELSGASFLIGSAGTLSVTGQGQQGIGTDTAATSTTLSSGNATFTGLATQGNGILIDAAFGSNTGSGSILLIGTGSSGFSGIAVDAAIAVQGSIILTLEGTSSSASTSNGGIDIASSGSLSSATGTISLVGIQDAPILLNSTTIHSTGADISVTGPVILQSSTPIFTANSGNITFNNTIDGAFGLSATASGTLSFLGNVGSTTPLTAFSTTASAYILEGNITIANSPLNMSGGNVTLQSNVSISTGTSSVTFGGTVTGAYNFDITAATAGVFLGNNISTTTLAITPAVTLDGDVTLTTSSSSVVAMVLSSTVSATNHNFTLVAGSGYITLGKSVSLATGTFTASTGTQISFGGSVTAGTVDVAIPAILTAAVTFDATSTTATFGSTIDGDYGLTIAAVGDVILDGALGGTTPLGNVSISGSALSLNQNISTNDSSITLAIPITLTSDVVMNTGTIGGAISFADTITGAHNLTLDAGQSSDISFSSTVTGLSTLTLRNAANITAAAISAVSIEQIYSSGAATYNGLLTTTGALNLNGNSIAINGGIDASAGVILTHTGELTLAGAVTLTGGTFEESGGGTVLLSTTVTTPATTITFNSPISLTGTSTIDPGASTAIFNRSINGANSLTVTATGGTALFASDVGNTTPVSTLSVTATAIQIAANQSVTTSLSHTGSVALLAPITLTNSGAGAITITGTVTGNYSFTLLAPQGSIDLTSAVDLSSVSSIGEHLYAYAGGAITCGDTLTTSGTYAGNVTLISTTGNVSVSDIITQGTAGDGGNIYLQPGNGYTAGLVGPVPNGLLLFTGDTLDATSTGGQDGYISLSPLGRATPMSVATISASGDLSITGSALAMGAYEALTSFGSLTIITNGYCTFADIVVLNTIYIVAGSFSPAIFLISRESTDLLTSTGGSNASPNTHILAGTALTISGGYVPSTLNVAVTPITSGDLTYLGTVLNYDDE